MQTTATVKVGAAFLAGIVVALGSAFIYLRASDGHVRPLTAEVVPAEEKPPATPVEAATPVEPKVNEQPDVAGAPRTKAPAHLHPRVTSRPVSLAVPQRTLPAQEPITQELPPPTSDIPTPVVQAAGQPVPLPVSQPIPQTIPQPNPQPHTVTLPAGTSVAVRLNEKLSSEHNYTGDTFRATLETPILMDGFIIADRGAKVLGRIVKAAKPGKLEGMAELSLVLTEVSTTDGQRVAIETNESLRKGPSNTNEEVIKMAGGAALGAIIGAIAGGGKGAAIGAGAGGAAGTGAVLLGHGKPAVIENETRLTFELMNPTTITEHLN